MKFYDSTRRVRHVVITNVARLKTRAWHGRWHRSVQSVPFCTAARDQHLGHHAGYCAKHKIRTSEHVAVSTRRSRSLESPSLDLLPAPECRNGARYQAKTVRPTMDH
ncbi:hypothetical protein L798_05637 [Zootermopsis nevadensis]|uniref:Uncharacterized protein n=1 Tax=Zootermopsis nevadensis TaxID=136037 RepID=A0A067RIA6_ZOONE|nr:hypothetical protein L798_05637 [Zootermopsis nevadensis]